MEASSDLEFSFQHPRGKDPVGVDLASELLVQAAACASRDRIRIAVKVKREAADPGGASAFFRCSHEDISSCRGHKKTGALLEMRPGRHYRELMSGSSSLDSSDEPLSCLQAGILDPLIYVNVPVFPFIITSTQQWAVKGCCHTRCDFRDRTSWLRQPRVPLPRTARNGRSWFGFATRLVA